MQVVVLFAVILTASHAAAEDEILLTVTYGDGSERAPVEMTLADLEALPKASFQTSTIWTDGIQTFEGVWLADLIAYLGIEQGGLELKALNEYLVLVDVDGLADRKALLAYHRNGKVMHARDKGPLWVVFPYDRGAQFQTETTYSQSIWQMDRLHAVN